MNWIPKVKKPWWQIFVFAEEAYLAAVSLILFVLAAGRVDVDGPTMAYMVWSFLVVIVGSFLSGIILVACGKTKSGQIAILFAASAFILLLLFLPALAAAKRRG